MRIVMAAAVALIAVSVTGCDINTTPKTTQVGCHCAVPPAAPAGTRGSDAYAPAPSHERYRAHRRSPHGYASWSGGGHSYYWRREYSEMSVFTYDYHSHSSSYSTGGHGGGGASAYAYAAAGAYAGGGAYAGAHGGGYAGDAVHGDHGYRVVAGATTGDPAHYQTPRGESRRSDVWHGYDVDCPDPASHR